MILQRLSAAVACVRSSQWVSPAAGSITSARQHSIPEDDSAEHQAQDHFWIPHETVSPLNIAQRRATGRVDAAIESVLLADGVIREQLVHRYGLNIHRVQVSKDKRSIYILWDANTGKAKECEQALQKNAFRLRRDLAKALQSKYTPYLEFRHNHLPPLKAAAATAMKAAEQELLTSAARQAAEQDIDAAVARLEQLTQRSE